MNDFIQVKEYLDKQLKENCDEFDQFLKIEIFGVDGSKHLSVIQIKNLYLAARKKVESGFHKDCEMFENCCENFGDIVSSIYVRGLKKIANLTEYRLVLVLKKYERYQGRVDKHTLLDWLSGNGCNT